MKHQNTPNCSLQISIHEAGKLTQYLWNFYLLPTFLEVEKLLRYIGYCDLIIYIRNYVYYLVLTKFAGNALLLHYKT